jgi:hypothetical protein
VGRTLYRDWEKYSLYSSFSGYSRTRCSYLQQQQQQQHPARGASTFVRAALCHLLMLLEQLCLPVQGACAMLLLLLRHARGHSMAGPVAMCSLLVV